MSRIFGLAELCRPVVFAALCWQSSGDNGTTAACAGFAFSGFCRTAAAAAVLACCSEFVRVIIARFRFCYVSHS